MPYRFKEDGRLMLNVKTDGPISKFAVSAVMAILRYPLRLDRFEAAARNLFADKRTDVHYWIRVSEALGQTITFDEKILARIPKTGPLVVVANHPLNGVEGLAIAAVLAKVRPDVRIALTPLLAGVPGLKEHAFFLNPYGGKAAAEQNLAVRDIIKKYVADGGALIMFPSGEVSNKIKLSDELAVDGPWKPGTVKLLKAADEVDVLPIFVGGVTSQAFQVARKLQNSISSTTVQMVIGLPFHAREISARMGKEVELDFGPILSGDKLVKGFENPLHLMAKLREITYALNTDENVTEKYAQYLGEP